MWDDTSIERALRDLTQELGKYPSSRDIRASDFGGLDTAISRHPLKHSGWSKKLGGPVRQQWTEERIERELKVLISQFGRMPSVSEMNAQSQMSLSNAINRSSLSFREWAKRMGAEVKVSETQRSYEIECWVRDELDRRGHTAEMTETRCPYDILLDGRKRVEVKMASKYISSRYPNGVFIFSFGKDVTHRKIDVSVLVCVDEHDTPIKVYILPKRFCNQQTITITGSHRWTPFLNAWDLL